MSLYLSEIDRRFNHFQSGIRVVMLIDRGIQNSNKGSKRWINKIVTTNEQEWMEAITSLVLLQDALGNPDIRLYSCVNSRSIDKAIAMFKHKQIDLQEDMKFKFYSKINNTFASCLMKPENRDSRLFLLDIDTKDTYEVDRFITDNLIKVTHSYPSKRGWHYVCEPFNVLLSESANTFCVKRDGLLLIRWIEDL